MYPNIAEAILRKLGPESRISFQSLKKWCERDGFIYSEGKLIARGDVVAATLTMFLFETHQERE